MARVKAAYEAISSNGDKIHASAEVEDIEKCAFELIDDLIKTLNAVKTSACKRYDRASDE